MLRRIDGLRGSAREEALEACLGVGGGESSAAVSEAIRGLAEAIEAAVRVSRHNLGLDWDPERE